MIQRREEGEREKERVRQRVRDREQDKDSETHTHKQCDRVEKRSGGGQMGCLDDFSALGVCLAMSAALGHVLLPLQTQKPLAPLLCQPLHMLQAALPMQNTAKWLF